MTTTTGNNRSKFTIRNWRIQKKKKQPITMMTAYDYTSAQLVEMAGIDTILVGDSLNMVMLGHDNTTSVTMDEMIHHCKAVARGASHPFLIGDMPFMSYQANVNDAISNAGRFLKEGGMDAVKIEGGIEQALTVEAIVRAGIPVIGHIGLTPQTLSQLGGFRTQGRTATAAYKLLESALALQEAGCFAIVLESVPAEVATLISDCLTIPTIGIGASQGCDGQVLVFHDALGLFNDFVPRFVKRYANLRETAVKALESYRDEVKERSFPTDTHMVKMSEKELSRLREMLQNRAPEPAV